MMRSISFVDRTEFEFSGNHFLHAVCLKLETRSEMGSGMVQYFTVECLTNQPADEIVYDILFTELYA